MLKIFYHISIKWFLHCLMTTRFPLNKSFSCLQKVFKTINHAINIFIYLQQISLLYIPKTPLVRKLDHMILKIYPSNKSPKHPKTDSSTHCPVIWDGMLCWNATLKGITALNKCPSKKGFEPTSTCFNFFRLLNTHTKKFSTVELVYLSNYPSQTDYKTRTTSVLASKVCTLEAQWWKSPTSGRHWSNYTLCVDFPKLQVCTT